MVDEDEERKEIEERKETRQKERRILDRKPKQIPGMEDSEEIIVKQEISSDSDELDKLEERLTKAQRKEKRLKEFLLLKQLKERIALAAETDYGWCDEVELPTIEVTFNENEDITAERTNRRVIK